MVMLRLKPVLHSPPGTRGPAVHTTRLMNQAVYIANLFYLTSDSYVPILRDVDTDIKQLGEIYSVIVLVKHIHVHMYICIYVYKWSDCLSVTQKIILSVRSEASVCKNTDRVKQIESAGNQNC